MFRSVFFVIVIAVALVLAFIIASGGENATGSDSKAELTTESAPKKKAPMRVILDFSVPSTCQVGDHAAKPTPRVNLTFTNDGTEVRKPMPAQCNTPGYGVLKMDTRALPQPTRIVTVLEPMGDGC